MDSTLMDAVAIAHWRGGLYTPPSLYLGLPASPLTQHRRIRFRQDTLLEVNVRLALASFCLLIQQHSSIPNRRYEEAAWLSWKSSFLRCAPWSISEPPQYGTSSKLRPHRNTRPLGSVELGLLQPQTRQERGIIYPSVWRLALFFFYLATLSTSANTRGSHSAEGAFVMAYILPSPFPSG